MVCEPIIIYENALEVDKLFCSSFQTSSRGGNLPKPSRIEELDNHAYLTYGRVDGRVVALRFVDYLKQSGLDCDIVRPKLLDDPRFDIEAIMKMDETRARMVVNSDVRGTSLASYSCGEFNICDEEGNMYFTFKGGKPNTKMIQITPRLGNKVELLSGFLSKIKYE